jgi:GH35 family endo-1,4-beta-xylanase
MQVRLHPVLFPGDKPLWMKDGFTQDDLDNIVQKMVENAKQQHMTEIVVVNESGAPPYDERKDVYWKKFGMGYIIRAFQMAREIYPEAKLIYNDGKNHLKGSDTTKSTLLVAKKLYQEGLIDYVGVEMHIDQDHLPNKQDLIDVFINYPVPVVITEYDALLTYLPEDQRDAKLSEITKTVFDGCLESTVCISINTWGTNDSVGWQGRSVLRDADNKRKQAYYVAMQSMFEHLP